jgi:GH43 family beta-xylosidase
MKKLIIVLLTLMFTMSLAGCATEKGELLSMEDYLSKYTYKNTKNLLPAEGNVGVTNIGDPQVFYDENEEKYIMTGTFDGRVFKVWTSVDLTTWDQGTQVFSRGDAVWASETGLLWGAEIHERNDQYYLYYSIEINGGTPRIGVATADNVFGPFVDKGSPLFDFGYSAIDNNLFTDTDGISYMYYVRDALDNVVEGVHESHIYVVKMNDDFISTKPMEESVELIVPDQSWEMMSGGSYWNWVEGCFVHKEGDSYYLFYSANKFNEAAYSVGYAVSNSPTGPFVKSDQNPLMYTVASEFSGPGNNSLFYSKDGKELFTAYHMHTTPDSPSGNRYLNIDRIGFRSDGSVFFNGPTITHQPLPSGEYPHHNLISREATVTVSSTMEGFNPIGVNDGEMVILSKYEQNDWVSGDLDEAFVKFEWDKKQSINSIYIYQARNVLYRPLSVTLEFSDGTLIEEVVLSTFIGEAAIINFNGVICDWVKITVNEVGFGQSAFGLSEVMIFGTK